MPKKTKARKVTDKDKAWNRKAKPSQYKIEEVQTNKIVLIVCDGQTEELYFKSFPVYGLTVEAIKLEGQAKLKLVELILDMIKLSDTEYDEVWCVFDMDVNHGEVEFAQFDNAIEKCLANNLKPAYSNDCFELWFFLHFEFTEQQHHRTFYYEFLSKKWSLNYEKDGKKRAFCLDNYKRLQEHPDSSRNRQFPELKNYTIHRKI